MDRLLPPEDAQGPQGQSLHLVLAGDDHHLHQVVEVVDNHAGELFGVGQPPSEDDGVDELGEAAQHDAHPLGDLEGLGLVDQGGPLVPVLDAPLDLLAVVSAQQGGHAALATELFQHLLFGVLA